MDAPGLSSETRSLSDVHSSVGISQISFWRRMFAFAGPAYLVSVGYMDPGNWATDIEGGARFGYRLLWVLVMSNAMAILLQTLSARLGIVSGRDLAQACRETYPRRVNLMLWALCEIAIAACDLAEVLGAAIGLNLLFHIPLLAGVLLTAADTLLLLWFQSFGIRTIEAFVLSLIAVIAACFCIEIIWAKPSVPEMMTGLVPRLNGNTLYVAITILGATVMPHNMYLHSALVQTRNIGHYRIREADGLPLQSDRLGSGSQRRPVRECGHPGAGGGGLLQARHRSHRNPAGPGAAGAPARHRHGGSDLRHRSALLGPIVHADRNPGRPDRDGGVPQLPHASLAAAPDHADAGDDSRGPDHLHCRRKIHLRTAAVEPGNPQHATAFRHHPPDPLHQ